MLRSYNASQHNQVRNWVVIGDNLTNIIHVPGRYVSKFEDARRIHQPTQHMEGPEGPVVKEVQRCGGRSSPHTPKMEQSIILLN